MHDYHGPEVTGTLEWTEEDDAVVAEQRKRAELVLEATVRKDSFFDLTHSKKPVPRYLRLKLV